MDEDPAGGYVAFEDYDALRTEVASLRARVAAVEAERDRFAADLDREQVKTRYYEGAVCLTNPFALPGSWSSGEEPVVVKAIEPERVADVVRERDSLRSRSAARIASLEEALKPLAERCCESFFGIGMYCKEMPDVKPCNVCRARALLDGAPSAQARHSYPAGDGARWTDLGDGWYSCSKCSVSVRDFDRAAHERACWHERGRRKISHAEANAKALAFLEDMERQRAAARDAESPAPAKAEPVAAAPEDPFKEPRYEAGYDAGWNAAKEQMRPAAPGEDAMVDRILETREEQYRSDGFADEADTILRVREEIKRHAR
jgi:hypothetical protein